MRLLSLFKPEYVYRPRQVLRRIRLTSRRVAQDECVVDLPWGLTLSVNPHELIGNCVARLGVYDLTVSEALWRLLDPGETAVDVGSNVGYTASILAQRTGPTGQVYCFEPHPDIFRRLQRNVSRWDLPVSARNVAVSDDDGEAELRVPRYFPGNQGTASLAMTPTEGTGQGIKVHTLTLDGLDDLVGPIGVMKVDVEGHEPAVFHGAQGRLQRGEIRDIVFEDHGAFPTPAMRLLADYGYRLYALRHRFRGPYLTAPRAGKGGADPPNYLATLDPERAEQRFAQAGWSLLTRRSVRG
ncbi:MAG: FkbM family methyltransferase [Thermaerobacter sp.]|nr:FkbM family methyltransferase [Thermaerobacter sp.]